VSSDPVSISKLFHSLQKLGLTRGSQNCDACAIDLAEFALEGGEAEAHFGGLAVREDFERALVDGAHGGEAVVGSGFCYVDGEHLRWGVSLESCRVNDSLSCTSNLSSSATTCVARSNMAIERFATSSSWAYMRKRGLHDLAGHFSSACSKRSRARSIFEPF
jgi:hypothetical protein